MRPPFLLLTASLTLLAPATSLAADQAVTDFAVELILPAGERGVGNMEVECREGCNWTRQTITCSSDTEECRGVVAGTLNYDLDAPTQEPEPPAVYPIEATACMGLNLVTDPVETKCKEIDSDPQHNVCEQVEVPTPESRTYVHEVGSGSPAEEAGILGGDVLLRFNDTPVQQRMHVMELVGARKVGQPFIVLLERDGGTMTLQGTLGIRMSDSTCAVASAERLAAAAPYAPPPPPDPFELIIRAPGNDFEWNCLRGCNGGGSGGRRVVSPASSAEVPVTLVYRIFRNHEGFGSGTGTE
jgi:hypothetical protein